VRSRPALTVLLRPGRPLPAQTLEVEARFVSETDTPLDEVSFDLLGQEVVRVQRGKNSYVWRHEHVHLRAAVPGRPLTVGEHTYKALFQLPKGLPPNHSGRFTTIAYTLEVRADIPWWPDRVGRYEVPIEQVRVEPKVTPAIFVSHAGGPRAGQVYVEMSLASSETEVGGLLTGTVAFTNPTQDPSLRIALVARERLFADAGFFQGGSIRESYEVQRWAYPIAQGGIEEGRAYPFQFAIAPETKPTILGAISASEWGIEVTTEGVFARKCLLFAPITIVPRTGLARPAPTLVPAIGHERRMQSFQNVAARTGLVYDPARRELGGTIGDVVVRVGPETRPDGSPATTARLAWPALGMGLRVEAGSWIDALSSREIDLGYEVFDRRFHVRSRFAAQAKALFDQALCDLVMAFPEAAIDDEGATLSVPIALVDEAPLSDFVERATRLARRFSSAFERVPAPPALAESVEAWRAFAARVGGRFEIGSGSIREATLGQERMEITTEWREGGELLGTVVRVPLGVRIDAQAISPAAQAQRDALEKEANAKVTIKDEEISLLVDRLLTDPLAFEPAIDALARLVQTVRGRGGAGPFR